MKRNLMINKVIVCILTFAMLFSFSSCNNDNDKKVKYKGNYIYYADEDGLTLSSREYTITSNDTQGKIDELIKQIQKYTLPDDVIINGTSLLDGILTIDVSQEYANIKKKTEVLIRASLVLTITQVESVDYVAITVNDKPLTKTDGTVIGNMQATDFVDGYGSDNIIAYSTKFVLYYANEDGTLLKGYDLIADYTGEQSKEEFIVKKIIEGPDKKGYNCVLSQDTELISVLTTDNICYVNFGDNFLTEQTGMSPNIVLYSIVNSLSELNYVHKVQIFVNGKSTYSYNGISLENPFIRNLDYVADKEKEEVIKGE